jgi:hypothetical protein
MQEAAMRQYSVNNLEKFVNKGTIKFVKALASRTLAREKNIAKTYNNQAKAQ